MKAEAFKIRAIHMYISITAFIQILRVTVTVIYDVSLQHANLQHETFK